MDYKNKLRWSLAILAAVLLVLQLVRLDFEWTSLLGPISMVLLILAMIASILHSKKNEK